MCRWGDFILLTIVTPPVVEVIDVHNPSAPSILSSGALSYHPSHIAATNGNYAYVKVNDVLGPFMFNEYLNVVNLTDPLTPTVALLQHFQSDVNYNVSDVNELGISDDSKRLVCTGADQILQVYDISSPLNPSFLGSLNATNDQTTSLLLSDTKAFTWSNSGFVKEIDFSNPSSMQVISSGYGGNSITGLAKSGDIICTADPNEGLKLINFGPQSSPRYVKSLGDWSDASASGNYLYAARGVDGLDVIDVNDPQNPESVGQVYSAGSSYFTSVTENHLLVLGSNHLSLFDISNPDKPAFSGQCNLSLDAAAGNCRLVSKSHYAYADDSYSQYLHVIDFADAFQPMEVAVYKIRPS